MCIQISLGKVILNSNVFTAGLLRGFSMLAFNVYFWGGVWKACNIC